MTADGYTQTYDAGEASEAIIDNVVGIAAALFSFVSIIALVLLWSWLKKNVRKR
jgi:hypothetical protein